MARDAGCPAAVGQTQNLHICILIYKVNFSLHRFSDGRYCNETCDNQAPCFPIPVPAGDPRIRRHRCIGTTRSSAMCGSGMTSVFFKDIMPREQMNQITGYIDASNVYGSSEEESYGLRWVDQN